MSYNTPNNWGSNNNLQNKPSATMAKVAKGHYQQGASRTVGPPQISSLAHPANAAQAVAISKTALTGTLSNVKNTAVNYHPRPGSNRGIHSAVQQHSSDAFAAKGVTIMQGSNNPYAGELPVGHPGSHLNQKIQSSNYSLRNSQKVKHSSVGYQVTQTHSAGKQTSIMKSSHEAILEGTLVHSPQPLSASKVLGGGQGNAQLLQPLARGDSDNPLPSFIMTSAGGISSSQAVAGLKVQGSNLPNVQLGQHTRKMHNDCIFTVKQGGISLWNGGHHGPVEYVPGMAAHNGQAYIPAGNQRHPNSNSKNVNLNKYKLREGTPMTQIHMSNGKPVTQSLPANSAM
jgi:hypothetical protein